MNTEEIQEYIDRINSNSFQNTIFIRPINKSVIISRVWRKDPFDQNKIENNNRGNLFFFIKNEENFVVGAVLDMRHDLHWYLTPKFRKKGYLTKALKEVIIPYIFCNDFDERNEQEISIKKTFLEEINYNSSRKVAESLGFKTINDEETKFLLKNENFDWSYHNENQSNTFIDNDRFEFLKSKLTFIKLNLKNINDELTMKCNNDSLEMVLRELEEISLSSIVENGNSEI